MVLQKRDVNFSIHNDQLSLTDRTVDDPVSVEKVVVVDFCLVSNVVLEVSQGLLLLTEDKILVFVIF